MINQKTTPKPYSAVQSTATLILLVSIVFLIYQLYLTQNSFSALSLISQSSTSQWQRTGSIWPLIWLTSESSGEVGLFLRLVGACFFVATAWLLLRKQQTSFRFIGIAVFLEAAYFLFYIPFITFLLTRPSSSSAGVLSGISYTVQTLLVSPALFMLYRKLKSFEPGNDAKPVVKWFAIAFCCYVFALWVKHFIFAVYAVGINFSEPVLIVGSINSVATLLVATVGALIVFLPVIREKRTIFNLRSLGTVLSCIGAYFVVFICISLVNADYLTWLPLTEWWATSFLVLGIVLVIYGNNPCLVRRAIPTTPQNNYHDQSGNNHDYDGDRDDFQG